jgi:uncharacterized spore protein YtfJ
MNTKHKFALILGPLCILTVISPSLAQAPLEQPLANFDKLVSNLKIGAVVGEPIQVGNTTIIPFAKVTFGLGGGGAMMAYGGGMGGKTIPLGILIIEGETVRAELFPEEEKKPSFLMEMLPVLLKMLPQFMEKKSAPGAKPAATAPQAEKKSAAAQPQDASLNNVKKLFEEKRFSEALEMADVLLTKDPKSADLHVWKGNAMGRLAQGNPADMMKYGMGAMQEYETALALEPQNQGGHFGRGMARYYMGNADGAIEDFEFACAKNPFPEACFYLGEAYKAKGLTDKAKAAYKKALELQPGYPEAAKALAEIK